VSELSEKAADLTADLIVDATQAAAPVISPDGRWVAWTTSRVGERKQQASELWLAPVGRSAVPARLTDGSVPARLPRWSPDSAWLFYAADEEIRRLRITADGAAGGAEPVLRWGGDIAGLVPLAGGRLVAVVTGDELTKDDERRRAEGDDVMVWSERAVRQHWLWHRLRLLDLASGELTLAAGLAGRHVVDVAQRPGGGPLAVVSRDCPEDDPGAFTSRLHIADLDADTVVDLGLMGLEAHSPAWWQGTDGWHVAWLAAVPPADATAVLDVAVPADGTAVDEPADLTAEMTACPDELVQVAGGPPVALFAEGLDTALYRLDAAGPSFTRVAGWTGRAAALTASGNATMIAVLTSTAYSARDVRAGSPDDLIRISDTRPELRGVAWGAQERLSWRALDGLDIDGVLILPPGRSRADGPFPLVTMVHGGPYSRWADELMASWWSSGQWLAAAGCAVFHPNPRGSQGHGQAFAAMVAGAVGRGEWTDILAGVDDLVKAGVADPGRAEASLGGSFGWEGPGPHLHDQLSPISYAANVTTPLLILHGANDTNVPVGQAMYFHRALTQFGAEHELVIYPRENHGFAQRAHRIDVLERTRSWFTRWLGDSAA
jgi:dipeptidyl aminopeptidase/acylaminoacyl peptidase